MHHTLLSDLGIVLMVAAITGIIARRLGQPSVLGYLLAGLVVGPYLPVPLFADPHRIEELAEVGVVLVLLAVGLEFRVQRLLEILPVSGITAAVQISALAWAGYTVGAILGWSTSACITLAACLAVSSTMVVSAVFRTSPVDEDVRGQVFGVLVIQDVVAIVLIAVVTALAGGETLGPAALAALLGRLAAVVVGLFVLGMLVLPRLVRWVLSDLDAEALVVLVAGMGFGFALAAESFGFSAALGAFVAGMAIAESGRAHEIEETIEPLRATFAALFFVSIGMAVDPVVALGTLPLALLLTVVVVVGQLLSVGIASLLTGGSLRRSVISGLALGQIGEFAFILATIAIGGGIVEASVLPALVTVATLTAFTTPLLLSKADRLISAIDRWLPDRATELLSAYQALLRRSRAPGAPPVLRGPAIALALDWVALLLLAVVALLIVPSLAGSMTAWAQLAVAVCAVPFVVGLVRSSRRLAGATRSLVRDARTPAPVASVLELGVLLAAVLAGGIPTLAVLRPVLGTSGLEIVLLVVLGTIVTLMVRRVGATATYSSEVARLASRLAEHVADPGLHSHQASSPGPLAGLDYVTVTLDPGAAACGKSLTELDLRCRTGATVVAICRGEETIVLPTGSTRLATHDLVAVSGSDDAIARTRDLLMGSPEPAAV